jgi:hypothetical protein
MDVSVFACHRHAMRNASFYEVSAQVIPTVFIAVLIELRALLGSTVLRWETVAHRAGPSQPEARRLFRQYAGSALLVWIAAIGFVVSEVSAMSVVLFGVSGWLPEFAVWTVGSGVVVLTFVAVVAPLWLDEIKLQPTTPDAE